MFDKAELCEIHIEAEFLFFYNRDTKDENPWIRTENR